MKVLTISQKKLQHLSSQLFLSIQKDMYTPDIIVGIATGGIYVSNPIKNLYKNQGWKGFYTEIKLSRSSTDIKKKSDVRLLLTKLPYWILNILRTIEVSLFEMIKPTTYNNIKESDVFLPKSLQNKIHNANSLLLIDDAIDTGSTILALKNIITTINPNIKIKVAVLTMTHSKPYIEPNFTLYKRVLLRCPWAEDYKGDDKIE